MSTKLEAELKAITKERSRAIRETMTLFKAQGVPINRKLVERCVGHLMTTLRLAYAPRLEVTTAERARLLERQPKRNSAG